VGPSVSEKNKEKVKGKGRGGEGPRVGWSGSRVGPVAAFLSLFFLILFIFIFYFVP
jgi:hypothetical protein